ncbi:uncharacterized protein LOC110829299 isoform X2 [Zootermopsis nevadensis]|nr:uncharacterized protein LOC110829299 isoform X2 [Zootermopsis nevadensis]XP_021918599.1 uncharacterized protein LOC110829299 isoform X2 [Zootermopsis nevadensis]
MLKEDDTASSHLITDNENLDLLLKKFKQKESPSSLEEKVKIPTPEESYDMEDSSLKIRKMTLGTNLKKNDEFINKSIQDQKVDKRSTNEDNKEQLETLSKPGTLEPPEEYDYERFNNEYYNEIENALHNTSFNYTKNGLHDAYGDAIFETTDFEETKNCSMEENRIFGIKSINCLWDDFIKSNTELDKVQLTKRIIMGLGILLLIYIAIAVPCWCKFGLCCCCFRCKFCWPNRIINDAKKYLSSNPPGVSVVDGIEKQHDPTVYETKAYDDLLLYIQEA